MREHQGSVALRGPGGGLLPAAVLGGAYESCRGKLAFSMEKTGVNELVRRGVALGHGAIFRRGQIYVGETPILKSVADVIPLHETPATVAVRGDRFPSPVPGAKARKNDLVFKALDRTSKAVSFGRVTPLIGSVALDMDRLDEKDLVHLKQIFDVATVK